MNIVYKILLGFSLLFPMPSFAQKARIADLRVTIISPLANSSIKSPGTVKVKFSVFNKGPNEIKPSDTIRYYPKSNDTLFKFKRVYSSKTIQAGDSEIFIIDIPFNSPFDNNYYNLGIASLAAYNRSSDSLRNEPLTWQKDNSSFIQVKHRSETSNVIEYSLQNQFSIFPNPANGIIYLRFEEKLAITGIAIFDLNGSLVKECQLANSSDFEEIKIDNLPNGVYYIKCFNNINSICKKLIIMH